MTVPESPTPKKSNTTVWIIVGVAIVLLICCALLVAAVVGGLIFIKRSGTGGAPIPQPMPFLSTPNQVQPNATPLPSSNGPLVVEPFDPSSSNYPALPDLVPNWKGQTQPGSQNWSATVPANQPVLIMLGWCTSTAQVLQQNDQQIKWSLTVDGQPVDVSKLFTFNQQQPTQVCKSSVGLIRQWPGTTHKIVTTMTVAQKINDGFSDYAPGDYTDVYNVTVGP
jgi:hypothetical protein